MKQSGLPRFSSLIPHPSSLLPSFLRSRPVFKTWRAAVFAFLIVAGGVVTAVLTTLARRANDSRLAFITAALSLMFVLLMGAFVVPPLVRAARSEVAQYDLPVSLTWRGVAFALLMCAVALAAWRTGNNLLFLIFSICASVLFVSWMGARATLRDVGVAVRFPDYIFAGESIPVAVTINNRKWLLPGVSLFIKARRKELNRKQKELNRKHIKQLLAYFAYVPRRKQAKQTFTTMFAARGTTTIGGFDVSSGFPFGFVRVRQRLRTRDMTLTIFPRLENEREIAALTSARMRGDGIAARRGEGAELYSLRRYMPHDDRRRIAWKATARTNRLMVREHLAEDELRVSVVLDVNIYADDASDETKQLERFERAISIASALVMRYANEAAELRLTIGNDAGIYANGTTHAYDCLHRLAVVAPRISNDFWKDTAEELSFTRDEQTIIVTIAPKEIIGDNIWQSAHVICVEI